jgi:hypothetical protein
LSAANSFGMSLEKILHHVIDKRLQGPPAFSDAAELNIVLFDLLALSLNSRLLTELSLAVGLLKYIYVYVYTHVYILYI